MIILVPVRHIRDRQRQEYFFKNPHYRTGHLLENLLGTYMQVLRGVLHIMRYCDYHYIGETKPIYDIITGGNPPVIYYQGGYCKLFSDNDHSEGSFYTTVGSLYDPLYTNYHQLALRGEEIGCLSIAGDYASRPQTSQCGVCSCYYEDVDHYAHNMSSSHEKEKRKGM